MKLKRFILAIIVIVIFELCLKGLNITIEPFVLGWIEGVTFFNIIFYKKLFNK